MAKKAQRPATKQVMTMTEPNNDVPAPVDNETAIPAALENIRADALARQSSTGRTIAALEAWRDEINATIAFLQAQRK